MSDLNVLPGKTAGLPFDAALLDGLMDRSGIDAVLASSKHNVQYLLGGHRSGFFDYMDAIGLSRYLPLLVYPKGKPGDAGYFGSSLERHEVENEPFWPPVVLPKFMRSSDVAEAAISHLRAHGLGSGRIAVEQAFLPMDVAEALRRGLPDVEFVDATPVLERLRARKSKQELVKLREASERVVQSMMAMISAHGAGSTKRDMQATLREEEVKRGLVFEYALITLGASHNRARSDQAWQKGEVLSVDSGGNYHGYIGDLCRMGVLGEPDAELDDLLAEVEAIQQAARRPVRAGTLGREIYQAAEAVLRNSPNRGTIDFLAHGMGLVSHEVPHLTSSGPVPYPADDADRKLEAGMVLSIETTLIHPRRGFIKLEDTLAVTDSTYEAFGDGGRGWNRGKA